MAPAEPGPASLAQNPETADDAKAVCVRSLYAMAHGDLSRFEALFHPAATNREAADEPRAARGEGPAAFYATAVWLRGAFSDLRWDIHQIVAENDLVVVHAVMSGRHTGTFAHYDDRGVVSQVMPPTGRAFSARQTHWFRLADGKVIEHWATRDDLAMARQAGWIPPRPRYLVRMALAKRRARYRAGPAATDSRESPGIHAGCQGTAAAGERASATPRHPTRPRRRAQPRPPRATPGSHVCTTSRPAGFCK